MPIRQRLMYLASHLLMAGIGGAAGIYLLPLLVADPPPSMLELAVIEDNALLIADFDPGIDASDFLHWGKGRLYLSSQAAGFIGSLSPSLDLSLYVSTANISSAADFDRERSRMIPLGRIRSFQNFLVPYAEHQDLSSMRSVVIWSDSFDRFITAAPLSTL